METYLLRRLKGNDLREFEFMSQTHESLPSAWVDNYIINIEDVEETVKRLVKRHNTKDIFCYIAEKDSEIISFIWAEINEIDKEIIDVFSLWTDERYRGQGIAYDLKIELEKWAKSETNANYINTTVSAKNKSMIYLNERLGYEILYHKMIKKI